MRLRGLKLVAILLFTLFSSSAYSGLWKSFDPSAIWLGTMHQSGKKDAAYGVAAFYEKYKVPGQGSRSLKLNVYKLRASASAVPLTITYKGHLCDSPTVELSFPAILKTPVILTQHPADSNGQRFVLDAEGGTFEEPLLHEISKVELSYDMQRININIEGETTVCFQLHFQEKALDELEELTPDVVAGLARFLSFRVREAASQAHDKRREIDIAMSEIAPKINLRTLFELAIGEINHLEFFAYFDLANDLCGILYPAHWKRFDFAKHAFEAQISALRHQQGDSMLFAETIFYEVLKIEEQLQLVNASLREKSSTDLLKRKSALESAKNIEIAKLAHAIAYPVVNAHKLKFARGLQEALQLPHETDFKNLLKKAETTSFQKRKLKALREVAGSDAKAAAFSCCRPKKGIYCTIANNPCSPEVRIAENEREHVDHQIHEVESLLAVQVMAIQQRMEHLRNNYDINSRTIQEVGRNLDLELEQIGIYYEVVQLKAHVDRLAHQGHYEKLLLNPLDPVSGKESGAPQSDDSMARD